MNLYQNRIVVDVGTSTLTTDIKRNDYRSFDKLTCVLSDLHNRGYEIILVSSGAETFGFNKLNLKKESHNPYLKQAAAAVGQCNILFLYDKFFSVYGKTIGQVLLTTAEMAVENDTFLNAFETLLEMEVIPIVCEKETVLFHSEPQLPSGNTTAEHSFLEMSHAETSPRLAASLAHLVRAGRLIFFHDSENLYGKYSEGVVQKDDEAIEYARAQGIKSIVLNGKNPSALYAFLEDKQSISCDGNLPVLSAL